MADDRRVFKFERSLREVISSYLISGFRHPIPSMLSVPHVKATKDFRSAKVYISFFGQKMSQTQQDECIETLNTYAHEVQRHIGKALPMKFCPKLKFYSDEKQRESLKVEKLIDQISKENKD